jgi:hypothetical protein
MRAVGFILKGKMTKYKKLLQHVRVYDGVSATKCFINDISYTIFYTLHLFPFKPFINNFHIWGILSWLATNVISFGRFKRHL